MIDIVPLDPAVYAGREYEAEVVSERFLAIARTAKGFSLRWEQAEEPIRRPMRDQMLAPWLEEPLGFGAFDGGDLLGFGEGFLEKWNNRFRVTNIAVFDRANRRRGVGSLLMERLLAEARSRGARMAVLETQTFNAPAVAFYEKHGFSLIGFDLYAYSNEGPAERNVRLEMGRAL